MHKSIVLLVGLAIAGCSQPVITDIQHDKLRVRAHNPEEALVEARRGCKIYGRWPVMISQACVTSPCTLKEYLVACVPEVEGRPS